MEGREGSEGQSHKVEEMEGKSGKKKIGREGGLYLDIYAAPPLSRVPSYATADVAGLPT